MALSLQKSNHNGRSFPFSFLTDNLNPRLIGFISHAGVEVDHATIGLSCDNVRIQYPTGGLFKFQSAANRLQNRLPDLKG